MNRTDLRHEPPLSEADLQAFADGQLASAQADRLHRYLQMRPSEARRVAFYGRLNAQLQHAFRAADDSDAGSIDGAAFWRAWLRAAARRAVRMLAGMLAAGAVAGGLLIAATRMPQAALADLAFTALQHAAADPTNGVVRAPAEAGATLAGIAPDISSVGLYPVAPLAVQEGWFTRASGFVYRNAAGEPVVLLRTWDITAQPMPQWRAYRQGTMRALYWTDGHTRYVLVGAAAARGLMHAADALTMHRFSAGPRKTAYGDKAAKQ
ncbi:anti-sigma factor family protein [Paraburkholderia kururiensis]|uniref:anti-sigma factor family protein n=1 Tax=Paraburkholderia kururiensis TaxID=984307 RepID=UPI0005A89E6E|nr:hypothetical protein [Paraburkholderia kururiensis]